MGVDGRCDWAGILEPSNRGNGPAAAQSQVSLLANVAVTYGVTQVLSMASFQLDNVRSAVMQR